MQSVRYLLLALLFLLLPAFGCAQIATRLQDCNNGVDAATCALTSVGANHTIVAIQDCYGSCSSISVFPTDTFGLMYTPAATPISLCTNSIAGLFPDHQMIFYAQTGSHTGSDTVSISTDTDSRFIWAMEYNAKLTKDVWSCGTGSATPMDSGALVTTAGSDLVVSFGYGTGFSSPVNVTVCCGNPGAGFNLGDATLGAAGTYHVTFATTSNPWMLQTLALKLASGTVAPTPRPWVINMRFLFSPHSYVRKRKIPWDDRKRKLLIAWAKTLVAGVTQFT
jgi:hypothetical protein